jgi:predicted nucleic acid-binding protein
MAVFVDTNILLYSVSSAPLEQDKRRVAVDILNRHDCVLSVQVLQEFYVQASGAKPAFGLPHDLAADFIKVWMRFRVEPITPSVMLRALDIKRDHRRPTGMAQ